MGKRACEACGSILLKRHQHKFCSNRCQFDMVDDDELKIERRTLVLDLGEIIAA